MYIICAINWKLTNGFTGNLASFSVLSEMQLSEMKLKTVTEQPWASYNPPVRPNRFSKSEGHWAVVVYTTLRKPCSQALFDEELQGPTLA